MAEELECMKKIFETIKSLSKEKQKSVLRACLYTIDENWLEEAIKNESE